ncbi:MAG: helix-turn-helix domain-containing protein, partial [Candidatus Tectomicrobia bacterium]|nr:helix-turn-helix domain-containing protein [Candidatus Tectomicrobia bacterium]
MNALALKLRIGVRIGLARKELSMTKKDLSGRMGVTYKTISKWEDGYWTPLPGSEKFDLLGQHLQKPPAFFSERKTPPVESGATTEASSPVSAISSQKSQTSFSRVAKRPTPNEDISTDIGRLRE